MKAYLSIFFSLTIIFISCEENDDSNKNELSILTSLKGEKGLAYNESLNKWTDLKKVHGNSYIYQTTFLSWTGFGNTTEVKILENKVTARMYEEFIIDRKTEERMITDSYSEDEKTLGSHEKGLSPFTIDELYNSCASDYLTAAIENNTLYFETEINGLMTRCGFVPKGCADDCYQGILIDSFDWID
tara:strand:- start:1472 stop:2032 length:561 start_codon:yes stop_codon:yes gene_type:complete